MLRSLGTVLLIVPLLLPQGVCVCDLFAACEACAEPGIPDSDDEGCCCCDCHKVDLSHGHTCSRQAPSENGERHIPGCPARNQGPQWKAARSPVLPVTSLLGYCGVPEPVAAIAQVGKIGQVGRAADQPRYLTLLALLI